METQVCKKCGTPLPWTDEFFYHSKNAGSDVLRRTCKKCFSAERRVHFKKNGRARKVELNPPQPTVVQCGEYDQQKKRCNKKSCRYHMSDFPSSPYTCLWEVTSAFKDGLSYIEIAGIVGLTDMRIIQIEKQALASFKRKGAHMEEWLEPEVDCHYVKPRYANGTPKYSERKITPVWHPNFFAPGAPVEEH